MLLQLPHFDYDVVKKLGRKKVRSLAELSAMDAEERLELFVTSGAAPPSAVSGSVVLNFVTMSAWHLRHVKASFHRQDQLFWKCRFD